MSQKLANGVLGSFTARSTPIAGEHIQHVLLVDESGDYVDASAGGGGASSLALPDTPAHSQTSCNNNSSTNVLATNLFRFPGSYLVNPNESVVFWIKEGAAAVVGEGYPLFYGGEYKIRTTDDVFAIQNSGSAQLINALEVTA